MRLLILLACGEKIDNLTENITKNLLKYYLEKIYRKW